MSDVTTTATPEVLDVGALPSLADYGYDGGRGGYRRFCANVFQSDGPRFLRSERGALVMFRHADLRAMATVPQLTTLAPAQMFGGMLAGPPPEEPPVGFAMADLIKNQLFSTNAPLNPVLRRILLNQIGPKPTAALADSTRSLATDILEALPTGTPIDLVRDVAEPLIGRYWGGLIGMTDEEALRAAAEARKMTPMLFLRQTPESVAEADAAAKVYRATVEQASDRNGARPVMAKIAEELAAVDIPDDLDHVGYVPRTAGAFLAGNLFDGFHTAALAATNTIYALLGRPEVLAELRSSPDKVAAAVSECLRLEPPVIHLNRFAHDDIHYDGHLIPKGTHVMIMWGVAGRDPAAFPDPDTFDLSRSQQGSTSFGGGAHICPGRFAATLMAKSLVEAVLQSGLTIRRVEGPDDWIDNNAMCQLRRLPVVLERAPSGKYLCTEDSKGGI
ncbi:cytochrome P450 [Phenylobacterium sp.]|uniref:cytochrome P450 n=1 Tax=Phenylobacterium sp. TaxID=1871053 RepID=UPI002FC5F3D6